MKQKSLISAILLIICVMANSQDKTYMNVQVGENEYKSFEVTPDLKVTWDSEKQEAEVSKPAVSNGSATGIAEMKATLTGKITSAGNGEITECGFYWGTTDNPSFKVICDAASDTLVYTLKGLKGNVKYYYRTFARNSKGETCGEVQSFKTKGLTQSSPAGTIGILEGIEAIVVDLPAVPASEQVKGWPNWNGSTTGTTYDAKKVAIATMNYGATSIDEAPGCYGMYTTVEDVIAPFTYFTSDTIQWYVPTLAEYTAFHKANYAKANISATADKAAGVLFTIGTDENQNTLFFPNAGNMGKKTDGTKSRTVQDLGTGCSMLTSTVMGPGVASSGRKAWIEYPGSNGCGYPDYSKYFICPVRLFGKLPSE